MKRVAAARIRRGATANPYQAPLSTPAAAAPTHTSTIDQSQQRKALGAVLERNGGPVEHGGGGAGYVTSKSSWPVRPCSLHPHTHTHTHHRQALLYIVHWLLCIVYSQTCGHPSMPQSNYQIAATPLVGQQIQRPAPSAALAAATCETDRVLHVGFF
jgi:hypothetical protein